MHIALEFGAFRIPAPRILIDMAEHFEGLFKKTDQEEIVWRTTTWEEMKTGKWDLGKDEFVLCADIPDRIEEVTFLHFTGLPEVRFRLAPKRQRRVTDEEVLRFLKKGTLPRL